LVPAALRQNWRAGRRRTGEERREEEEEKYDDVEGDR
jgi:hypothetical protein